MNLKFLFVVADIVNFLKNLSVLSAEGVLTMPSDVSKEAQIAQGVERILVNYGVTIPEKVDKIIELLPLIMELVQ